MDIERVFGVKPRLSRLSIRGKNLTPVLIRKLKRGDLVFLKPANRMYKFIDFSIIPGASLGRARLQVLNSGMGWTFPVDEGILLEAYRVATYKDMLYFMIKEAL